MSTIEKLKRKGCEICSKLKIETPERCFILNFEHILRLFYGVFVVDLNK